MIDWAQGDRVCTDCGVVDEQQMLDDRPEWRDFQDAADIVKGLPSGARSGLVAVDETKYIGGLQPTGLSKRPFGNPVMGRGGKSAAVIRKSLNATNRKLDFMMEKQQSKALKRARLSRLIKKKKVVLLEEDADDIQPEHDQLLLQEEEDAQRTHATLYAEKWSLERAILLHGTDSEQRSQSHDRESERDELRSRLDTILKRASSDMYMAYSILQQASQQLKLPPVVTNDATNTLCQYARRKDGLTVRGVSSRLTKSANAAATERLKDYNKRKQMASLAAALLFLDSRKHGHQRSLQEVCATFQATGSSNNTTEPFVMGKHCSKAMNELRAIFPDYMRAASFNSNDTGNFVEHATRRLELPPVAIASIQVLVQQLLSSSPDRGKMSAVCAAVTLFVTMAGDVMQRLARQAVPTFDSSPAAKRLKTDDDDDDESDDDIKTTTTKKKKGRFDIFAFPAVKEKQDPLHLTYEMRQMWDAWAEQMPWMRSVAQIEQSCQVSKSVLLDYYRTKIFPQRAELLTALQHQAASATNLSSTPRATVLLSKIPSATPLLTTHQGKV